MELWIRSKSKKRLVKANFIEIGNLEYTNGDVDIMVNDMVFGTYSKERALEVLDEIQELFNKQHPINTLITKDGLEVKTEQITSIVYQMPEE